MYKGNCQAPELSTTAESEESAPITVPRLQNRFNKLYPIVVSCPEIVCLHLCESAEALG